MKLVVGLGNPGDQYSLTRHNVGFMVVRRLSDVHDIKLKYSKRFKAITGEGIIENERCLLAMPETFMNLSGHSVCSLVNWLKIELNEVLLVFDDISLNFGDLKLKPNGRDAGHNGLRSVIEYLGTTDFPRLKIGIMGETDIKELSGYVLSKFSKKEQKTLPGILENSSNACEFWIKEGLDKAMNMYNTKKEKKKESEDKL